MRHFFGYTDGGVLHWSFVMKKGFGENCNLDDPDCTDPLAVTMREAATKNQIGNEVMDGIVAFDCMCTHETCGSGLCDCVESKRLSSYYDHTTGSLVSKPSMSVLVDGVEVSDKETLVKAPSSLFSVKVLCPDAPDGTTATMSSKSLTREADVPITFQDGVSTEVTCKAAAQGLTGSVIVFGPRIKYFKFFVKAF